MAGATDLSHLMVPHVAAFTAGEEAFMAAEERLGTGGTYAASTALILGNIRSVRNAPLKLLGKELDDDLAAMGKRLERLGCDQANTNRILHSIQNGEQVVVVGENMRRVNAVSNMVNKAGGRAITYAPRNCNGMTRNSLEANRSWIRYWGKDKGSTVIDIGRQPTLRPKGPSPFYGIENRLLNRWGIYTPFGN